MSDAEFGELVEKYEKLIYTICYQFTRDHHTAQDLAQETFVSAYRHLDTCAPDSMKPWLARIATNKAKDHLKSAYNRHVYAASDETLPAEKGALFIQAPQPEDIALSKEATHQIAEDIHALKEPYHQVAVLYFLQEQSVEDIAKRLERPPKTVHTQLYRAKNLLREKLRGGGFDESFS